MGLNPDHNTRLFVLQLLAKDISTEDLELVQAYFPALLTAALDEIKGKLEFISVQRCSDCGLINNVTDLCKCEEEL